MEESQLWAKLDALEQLCAQQGLDEHGGASGAAARCSAKHVHLLHLDA